MEKRTAPVSSRAGNTPRTLDRAGQASNAPRSLDRAGRAGNGPRTLEDIHIEGEIPVPQVLFVTVRDQRRFTQFHHRRYLKTSRELGEATVLPSRIVLSRTSAEPEPR